jgi:hypothetical protein
VTSKLSSLSRGSLRTWRYLVPTPTGPSEIFLVSTMA